MVARGFRAYLVLRPGLRAAVEALLEARTLEDQREIYERRVQPQLWGRALNWALSRQITMSMLGVPHPQKKEVERQHENGVAGFVREAVDCVFRSLPLWTNYFWTLYLRGRYARRLLPRIPAAGELCRAQGRAGRAHRSAYLHRHRIPARHARAHLPLRPARPHGLDEQLLSAGAGRRVGRDHARAPRPARASFSAARIALRRYLDGLRLGDGRALRDRLEFHDDLSAALQPRDRVHTYAGFHIADIRP